MVLSRLLRYARRSSELLQNLMLPTPNSHDEPPDAATLFETPLDCYDVLIHLSRELGPSHSEGGTKGDKKRKRAGGAVGRAWGLVPKKTLRLGTNAAREALLIGFKPVDQFVQVRLRCDYLYVRI